MASSLPRPRIPASFTDALDIGVEEAGRALERPRLAGRETRRAVWLTGRSETGVPHVPRRHARGATATGSPGAVPGGDGLVASLPYSV